MNAEKTILSKKVLEILRKGGASGIPENRNLAAKVVLLEAAMPGLILRAAREATSRAAAQTQALMSGAFEKERYYDASGRSRRLGRNSRRYQKWKAKQGYDTRRGHREGNLAAAIDQMVSVSKTGTGITLNLPAAAAASGAGAYADYYEEQKAPGLGSPRSIPRVVFRDWERYMKKRVASLAAGVLRSNAGSSLIPVLLSDRQMALWIGKIGVRLKGVA